MVKKVSEVLGIAIKREEDAYTFYMEMHGSASEPGVKESLELMAKEEKKHKVFLERYRDGGLKAEALRSSDVVDCKVAECLEEPELDSNSKPEDVFLVNRVGNRFSRPRPEKVGWCAPGPVAGSTAVLEFILAAR